MNDFIMSPSIKVNFARILLCFNLMHACYMIVSLQ